MNNKIILLKILLLVLGFSSDAFSQTARQNRFEVEGGVLTTNNMEISGYKQGSATSNWGSVDPTARFEYWSVRENTWNYGVIAQPLYAHYSDTLTNDLNNDGRVYQKGEKGALDYQFHTLRGTANYPVLTSTDGNSYLRLGGSLTARYANLKFKAGEQSFHDTNFLVLPLFNLESEVAFTPTHSIFTRSDFLPSIDGNTFTDGLFDVLLAVRSKITTNKKFDVGVRLFFGGYDPRKEDDYANRIFYTGGVIRYSW